MGVLKKYVHNRARPEGSISKGYGTEEVIEFCVDFIPDLKPIGVPESRYEGRLRGKGTLGKKSATCMDGHSFTQAHYTVLLNSILVAPYKEEHKEILRSKYPEQREDWIDGEHMKTFGGWLQTRLMNVTDDEQLYLLAKQPSSTISTFQGYEINGNTFYTFAQDKKSTNQNSGVRFDAEDGNGNKVTYYGYIEEIWELDYGPNFKVPLFRCKWFNLKDGVQVDPQYGMTTVDFKNLGHEEGGPPPSNFNEAVGVVARPNSPASWPTVAPLRYPRSQPTRAHPTGEYHDPASDDDDGDYDDYGGDYYEARHDRAVPHAAPPRTHAAPPSGHAAPPSEPRRAVRSHAVAVAAPAGKSAAPPRPSSLPRSHARSHSGVGAASASTTPRRAPRRLTPAVPRSRHADDAKPHSAASTPPGCSTKCRRRRPPMPPRCRCPARAARAAAAAVPCPCRCRCRALPCRALPCLPVPCRAPAAVPARALPCRALPVPCPCPALPLPCPAVPRRRALPVPCPCRCRALPLPCRCPARELCSCPAVPCPCRCPARAPCRCPAVPPCRCPVAAVPLPCSIPFQHKTTTFGYM
ncbi:hypothetical protein QYE76_005224 [Lolium multiflorum]|uniref:DUF4216 domain-containing protein n=1 Tax=Lolium multiflorum TaxID=4521 RepID=A0AAD8RTL3_LOLMU|nr:hypothetical protein QYE76_005224 [Lolium multiflorum]